MCLIITMCAAVVSTALWMKTKRSQKYRTDILMFMYWGAALMCMVDSVFSAVEGGPLFDISVSDAVLGIVIVLC